MYLQIKTTQQKENVKMKSAVEVREMLDVETMRMESIEQRIEEKTKEMKMTNHVGSMKSIMAEIEQNEVSLKEVHERLTILSWVLNK